MSSDKAILLQDDKLLLRAPEPSDLDLLYEWENDASLWNVSSAMAPYSKHQLWEYVKNYDGNIFTAGQLRLMVVERAGGKCVGMADLFDFDAMNSRAFVGVLIDKDSRRKGYAYGALKILAGYCRERLGMRQLAAVIPQDNDSSLKLFAKLGYQNCGILRSWLKRGEVYVDACLCQCLL